MEQNTEPQQPKYKGAWLYRHKIITSFLVIVLFLLISGLFNHNPNHAEVQGVSTSDPAATSTTIPTATDTPTPTDTPVPTLTPTPTIPPQHVYRPVSSTPMQLPEQPAQQQCEGATALCSDGTCSYSAHHQGTCSHHGGVAQWYN
jgi:hypothetical protein